MRYEKAVQAAFRHYKVICVLSTNRHHSVSFSRCTSAVLSPIFRSESGCGGLSTLCLILYGQLYTVGCSGLFHLQAGPPNPLLPVLIDQRVCALGLATSSFNHCDRIEELQGGLLQQITAFVDKYTSSKGCGCQSLEAGGPDLKRGLRYVRGCAVS